MADTRGKEKQAEAALYRNDIWSQMFPDIVSLEKVYDKERQISGIDYVVKSNNGESVKVDLKTQIGTDYLMHEHDYVGSPDRGYQSIDGIVIEIDQYAGGKWSHTNTEDKATDYMLYYVKDLHGERCYLIDYKSIMALSEKHEKYTEQTSFNGTGHYIKVPFYMLNVRKVVKV
jgi:hypothetical protein